MPNAGELLERFQSMQSTRAALSSLWEETARYVDPQRSNVITQRNLGNRKSNPLDITANKAIENLAAGLYATIINPADEWFNLRPSDSNLAEILEVTTWLEDARDLMMAKFAANGNRFYSQAVGMFKDLIVFGTAFFYLEEVPGTGQIIYKVFHPKNGFIKSNNLGIIDIAARLSVMSARACILEFGDNCSDQIKTAFQKNPDQNFDILHFVEPYMEGYELTTKKDKRFASYFVDVQNKKILREGGYYEFPYMTPRWLVRAEFDYGESPVWNALSSIKMVNAMKRVTLEAGEMVLHPPILAQSELATRANYSTTPGQVLYGTLDQNGRAMMQPLLNGAQVNFGIELIQQERDDINAAFYRDALLMTQNENRTATEALIIQEERQKALSYYFGQLQHEFLNPLITRQFNIMLRNGEFPPAPDELKLSPNYNIEYASPLARAQKAGKATSIQRTLQTVLPLTQVDPSVIDLFNLDEMVREIADAFGNPAKTMNDQDQIDEIREQRAQQQQAQQLVAAAEPVANAAKNAAQAGQIAQEAA